MSGTFSKRLGIGPCSGMPIIDTAPQGLRIGLWNLIEDLVHDKRPPISLPGFEPLYNNITMHFHLWRNEGPGYGEFIKKLAIDALTWNQIYDLIEFLFAEVYYIEFDEQSERYFRDNTKIGTARYQFTIAINKMLDSENIGWKLKKGKLERVGSDVLDQEVLDSARKLLFNPDFAGPNNQFNKALEFFNSRPKPDLENCVKEAVGALEGLAKILFKDNKITLGKAIEILVAKKVIIKPLNLAFNALYGYASSLPGSRHGAYKLSTIELAEAEFVLYTAATCMLFLAKKFGVIPVEEKEGHSSSKSAPIISDSPNNNVEDFPEDDDIPTPPSKKNNSDEFPEDDEVPF